MKYPYKKVLNNSEMLTIDIPFHPTGSLMTAMII